MNATARVQASLARIVATDGRVNAFTAVLAERALAQAARVDAGDVRRFTYRELAQMADRVAVGLTRLGVQKNDVVLFMKGTKMMPQCGFSSKIAGILNYIGVEYADVNVLADADIRQGIKDFSDWPTIPQLYVKGEFVGGCDIAIEMTLSGELDALLAAKGVAFDKDAAEKIRAANA